MKVTCTVNEKRLTVHTDPRQVLVDLLRDQLDLTGTKKGCGAGNCGACTVLLDGQAVYSCLILAAECEGGDIVTIEGLARGDELDPIQAAFVEKDAMQCGFCTPGQIMSIKGLQDRPGGTPLDNDDLRLELSGNLCRCGAYRHIHEAAKAVLDVTQPEPSDE